MQSVSGTNVIGILKGQFFNTANDEVVILGAHLDTRGILHEGITMRPWKESLAEYVSASSQKEITHANF